MAAMYGQDIKKRNDHYVEVAIKAVDDLAFAAAPGTFMVNSISILRYVPDWFPGTSFKRFARQAHVFVLQMRDEPIQRIQRLMVRLFSSIPLSLTLS